MIVNLILAIVALILGLILIPFGFVYGILYMTFTLKLVGGCKYFSNFFKGIALAVDQLGNVICQYLFNDILIKDDGVKFGNPDETVSSVLGKNKRLNTLSTCGRAIDWILNIFENDHSIKSIEHDIF